MNRMYVYQKVSELWQKCKRFYQNLNLFPSVPPSTDDHELKNQHISTKLYILIFIALLTILLLYTSLSKVTETFNVEHPTLSQFTKLYSKYSQALTCPCTHISINYDKFLHIEYTFHQICDSVFITDDWISHNDVIRLSLMISTDSRIAVSYAFQALRAFCELIESTIYNSLIQFNSTQFITASAIPSELFQSQTESLFKQFISSATNSFLLSLNMTRRTTQGNAFLSAELTNFKLKAFDGNTIVTATAVTYSNCNCRLSSTCIEQLSVYSYANGDTFFDVPGFYTGCYTIEALLQSNLQCFYQQTCVDQLQSYLSSSPPMNAIALDPSLPSQYFPNSTVKDLLNSILIEKWNSTQFYDRYYNECQPIQCSYTTQTRKSTTYIVTTMFGIVGGLITVLRFIVPRVVQFVRKKKNQERRSSFILLLRTYIPRLFPTLKNYCLTLNVFPSVPPSTDEHELKNQHISTRLFIFSLIGSFIILLLYGSLIKITGTRNVEKPTVAQYADLYSRYPQTLTCPCTHISIRYDKFVHIEYTLHQVCSSFFVSDQWVSHLHQSYGDTFIGVNFLWTGPNAFQALRAFCQLVESTISNSLILFNSSQYITASVVSSDLFHLQTKSFIDHFASSTTNNFLLSFNTVRNITYSNVLLSGLLTNFQITTPSITVPVLTAPKLYSNCSCVLSSKCITQSTLSNNQIEMGYLIIPGFYTGCYVIEALLQSTLQCFYDQSCLDEVQSYLTPSIPTDIFALGASVPTNYSPDTTIETLLNNLMIEKWNSTQLYDRYYNECQPVRCTYTIPTKNTVIYIITLMFGIFGGLVTVLRCVVPCVVKLIRKKKDQTEQVNVMPKRERVRILWQKCKDFCINLNLFPSVPPSTDALNLRIQRIATRLYILLLILSATILLLHTSLDKTAEHVNRNTPTLTQYSELYSTYFQTLTCPCTHISINYDKFLHIEYTFHQVCSSFFITDQWISYIGVPRIKFYVTGDFRITGPPQFLGLRALCELTKSTIYNSLIRFNSTEYITTSVVSRELFQLQTQSFINQFKSSTTNNFLLSLNMIRKMTQGNALFAGRQTNYKPYSGNNENIETGHRIYNCDCTLSMACVDNSSLFNGDDNTRVFNITGFYAGCYIIETLLRSSLQCFYDQSCLDGLQYHLLAPNPQEIIALNLSVTSQYFPNTTIESLLNSLMIEEWNPLPYYERYYNECQPIRCTYTIEKRNNIIFIITTLIGIIGGLTKISKILIPILIKIVVYCLRRWINRVRPLTSNDQ